MCEVRDAEKREDVSFDLYTHHMYHTPGTIPGTHASHHVVPLVRVRKLRGVACRQDCNYPDNWMRLEMTGNGD